MKFTIRILITVLLMALQSLAIGQKLHAFIFCDTNDPNIGAGASANRIRIDSFITQLALEADFILKKISISGADFNEPRIRAVIEQAIPTISPQDAIFLYFNCHGGQTYNHTDSFPLLSISGKLVSAYEIFNRLCMIKHRLFVTAIDACSEMIPAQSSDSFLLKEGLTQLNDEIEQEISFKQLNNYNSRSILSLGSSVIITSGHPGSLTWSTPDGSYFTSYLIKAFLKQMDKSNDLIDLDGCLKMAAANTYEETKNLPTSPYPFWLFGCVTSKENYHTFKGYAIGLDYIVTESTVASKKRVKMCRAFFRPTTTDDIDSIKFIFKSSLIDTIITLRSTDLIQQVHENAYTTNLAQPEVRGNRFNYVIDLPDSTRGRAKIYYSNGAEIPFYILTKAPVKKTWSPLKIIILILSVIVIAIFLVITIKKIVARR